MFANATINVGFAQRVVATLVVSALVLWSVGAFTIVQAANLTNVSDTVTTSEPSVTAAHTISFTIPTGSSLTDGDTVTITFEAGSFTVGNLASGDITVDVNTVTDPHASFATTSTSISFDSVSASAGQVVDVAIPDGFITNPATAGQSYEITIDTGNGDTGKTRVAIVDTVLVTAIVETTFDFVIDGLATSTSINGTSTTGSTTPTAIPFGVLTAGEIKTLAQELTVQTNARNGFVVTVQSDGDLESTNGAVIDNFDEGSDVSTPGTVWNSPVPNVNDETTWGHWGMTTNDSDIGSLGGFYASTDFGANEFIAASTTPREVFHHDGPADGVTADIGSTTVGYQIEITALQEAADDYQTTLTYIATPTF